jgi:hypothetical protein
MSKALEIAEIGNSLSVDGNGNLVFEAGVGITADVTGNADTATTLETARTIKETSLRGLLPLVGLQSAPLHCPLQMAPMDKF